MTYRYVPLRYSDSIRLLELDYSGVSEGQIRGRLTHTRLQANPPYSALSYVWGSKTSSIKTILLDGSSVTVTASLHDALAALASCSQRQPLWIDQISIDQANEVEKQGQIRIMGNIFRRAEMVIGWLGRSECDSDTALDFMRILNGSTADGRDPGMVLKNSGERLFRKGDIRHPEDLFSPNAITILAAQSLLQRPWFSRRWVVQEVVLAKRLELRCGRSIISGDTFFDAVENLCSIITDPPLTQFQSPYWNAHRLAQLRRELSQGKHKRFIDLAHMLSAWQCQTEQDHLNALWGLVDHEDPATSWFNPTVEVSCRDMYRDFAERHIEASRSLDILQYAGYGYPNRVGLLKSPDELRICFDAAQSDMPSWTPDWRISGKPLRLQSNDIAGAQFSASAMPTWSSFRGAQLCVRAVKVDTIGACGMPYCMPVCNALDLSPYQVFVGWLDLARSQLPPSDIESTFGSTLIMDGRIRTVDCVDMEILPHEIRDLFEHWLAHAHGFSYGKAVDEHDAAQDTMQEDWSRVEKSTRYGSVAEEVNRNRRFFITKEGKMGIGPVRIFPGASLYLIHGLATPFIVGEEAGEVILYGECFVNGMMYGELSESAETVELLVS